MGWIKDLLTPNISASSSKSYGPGDDFWYEPTGAANNLSGIKITPEIVMKASAVFACLRILSETVGSLPLDMFEIKSDGSKEPRPQHPLHDIISVSPNSWMTGIEFWQMMTMQAALEGSAYAEIVPGPRGAIDQLVPIRSSRVNVKRMRDRSLRFEVLPDASADGVMGPKRILLQEEMFRFSGPTVDGMKGLRVIDLASQAIGIGIAADNYAARVFTNALNIGGFLIHPKRLSEEGQANLVQNLLRKFAGSENAHRPIVLQEGMEFKPASMSARDAQLLEARTHQIKEVARIWRIPDHMMGIRDAQPRANVEQDALDFVKYTLRPWIKNIEQAIIRDLIIAPRRFRAKFNLDALLRGDSTSRAAYFSAALGSGGSPAWMTQNEVRRIEGFNAVSGGDELMAPTNPGDAVGEKPGEKSAEEPDDTDEEEEEQAVRLIEHADTSAERLVKKEIAAIRRNREKFAGDPDAFGDWLSAFYGGHVSSVSSMLSIPKSAAKVYCHFQLDQLNAAGFDSVSDTLSLWEDDLASRIDDVLKKKGYGHESQSIDA